MSTNGWIYDASTRRYRNEATGRFLSQQTIVKLRDDFIESQHVKMAELARGVAAKDITIQRFEHDARALVKETHAVEYTFGRGGRNAMTQSDWGRVGQTVKGQYAYLHQFTQQIADGELSVPQIAVRASMYMDAGIASHERGRAAAFGMHLPAFPADGSSECLSRCRCAWSIIEQAEQFEATWVRNSAAEHCATCESRGSTWAPLVIEKVAA